MASERDREIWDDATNAVCQAMQEQKMCNCPDGDCLAAKIDFSPEKIATATRTAPAATDTGLETVGEVSTVRESVAAFAGHMLSRKLKPGDLLCLRSQAEELLAAKDKQIALAETSMLEMHQELNKLEADNAALIHDLNRIKDHETELVNDNAAKDARIKELEAALDSDPDGPGLWRFWSKKSIELSQQLRDKTNTIKALEAKLAAAEKALEPFAKAALGYDDPGGNGPWPDIQDIFVTLGDCRRARAVWGGKSS